MTFQSASGNKHPSLFGNADERGQGYGETAEKYGRGGTVSESDTCGIWHRRLFGVPVRIDVAEGLNLYSRPDPRSELGGKANRG